MALKFRESPQEIGNSPENYGTHLGLRFCKEMNAQDKRERLEILQMKLNWTIALAAILAVLTSGAPIRTLALEASNDAVKASSVVHASEFADVTVSGDAQISGAAISTETAEQAKPVVAETPKVFSSRPSKKDGKRWRVGYYEGGAFDGYRAVLRATVLGLAKLGWMELRSLPEIKEAGTEKLWEWLSKNLDSDYIEFVDDAHYSAGWDERKRVAVSNSLLDRFKARNDLDLVIAMGTWAGKDLANDKHATPTIVLSTSDPISAGIIKSVEDSGFEHVHAWVDPGKYERQIQAFHEIINFKRLGVAFEDSVEGRSYAAMDVVDRLAQAKGFEVAECHTKSDISDISLAEKSVVSCFEKLAKEVDALYITIQGGVTSNSVPHLVDIANRHSLPTFSQRGTKDVKAGVLASLSKASFRYIGDFHAQTIAKVFNGAAPNQLAQLFEEPPKMAINLRTAELIGFDPPVILLGATDEIFNEIENPVSK